MSKGSTCRCMLRFALHFTHFVSSSLKFLALLKVTFRLQSIYNVRNVRFMIKDFHQLILRLVNAVRDNLATLYVSLQDKIEYNNNHTHNLNIYYTKHTFKSSVIRSISPCLSLSFSTSFNMVSSWLWLTISESFCKYG